MRPSVFPSSWYVSVDVERGAGGLDRFGNPLPVEQFTVSKCLLGPRSIDTDERLGQWTDTDAVLFHDSFVFQQNDILTISQDQRNAGRWEVVVPSSEWPSGTETRLRRVNQQ